MSIQLSLFPVRGFGLILPGGSLAHDIYADVPYFVRTKRAAKRQAAKVASTWIGHAEVVPLEIHPPVEGANGLPTLMILSH